MAENESHEEPQEKSGGRGWLFGVKIALVVLLVVFGGGLIGSILLAVFVTDTGSLADWVAIIRDLFIIVLALEGLMIGIALVVLVVQIAALINLLQNEVQPIVDNAEQTVTTVRGTTQFVSENLVEPVIKISSIAAGTGAVIREVLGIRKSVRRNGHKE
jgi:hypothetical protein